MVEVSNFGKICRLCLETKAEMHFLWSSDPTDNDVSQSLASKIKFLTDIEIERGDNRPENVCKKCKRALVMAFNFKFRVLDSDRQIREAIEKNEVISSPADIQNPDEETNTIPLPSSPNIDSDWEEDDLRPLSIFGQKRSIVRRVLPKMLPCTECGKSILRRKLKLHLMRHNGEKPHLCDICGKGFTWKFAMITHKRVHTGEKPYLCKHCGMAFRSSARFTEHSTIHTGRKAYRCEHCPLAFRTNGRLKRHIRVHSGEKPYKCSFCGRCFSERYNLKQHLRIHTGEKHPHSCSICYLGFARRKFFDEHVKTVHNETSGSIK